MFAKQKPTVCESGAIFSGATRTAVILENAKANTNVAFYTSFLSDSFIKDEV